MNFWKVTGCVLCAAGAFAALLVALDRVAGDQPKGRG